MDTIKKVWICFMERNRFSKHCCENQHPYSKNIRDKNSSKHSFVHCWCNLVAVRAASFDDKKFLIFQGGQWFVDQLWERWNQWVKNGSQWSSNYNLSSLEINGPSPPAEEDFFSPSSSKTRNCRKLQQILIVYQNWYHKGCMWWEILCKYVIT